MTTARYVFVLTEVDKHGCIDTVWGVRQSFGEAYDRMLYISDGEIIVENTKNSAFNICTEYTSFRKYSGGYIPRTFIIHRKYYVEDDCLPIVEYIDYGKEDKKCRLM